MKYLAQALKDEELGCFEKVQSSWKSFADQQAGFASLVAMGGTMQPLLRASEYRDLAIERAAKLKDQLRVRSAMPESVPER